MQKLFDFSQVPVIDNHCHLFDVADKNHNLAKILSLSLNNMPEDQLENTLLYRKMLMELGVLLNAGGDQQDILQARTKAMKADYRDYVAGLFNDAGVDTLLIDLGYQPAHVNLSEFETLVPAEVKYIYRIETVLDEIWNNKLDFNTAEELFYRSLDEAVNDLSIIAVKSIIGYRTGLDIVDRSRSETKMNWLQDEKVVRDFFLLRAMEKCIEYNLPMQIHASFGESNLNLLHNNPLLLKRLLENPKYNRAKIVLVHGGYPYSFEAGYLAAMYPNVFLDISEMIPFVPLGLRKGLRDMFDMCPLTKIMYGSDGYVIPEIHWLAAKVAKYELALLFTNLVKEKIFDIDYGCRMARGIFFNNAKNVYNV